MIMIEWEKKLNFSVMEMGGRGENGTEVEEGTRYQPLCHLYQFYETQSRS